MKAMIRYIVGNVHVGTTNDKVVETVHSKMKRPKGMSDDEWQKHLDEAAKIAIDCHIENQSVYDFVMGF